MSKGRYGLGSFLFDILLGCVTGGLWWAWILLKFLRGGKR